MSEHEDEVTSRLKVAKLAVDLIAATDQMLFGRAARTERLSPRDESLLILATLLTTGDVDRLGEELARAQKRGLTSKELFEAVEHVEKLCGRSPASAAAAATIVRLYGDAWGETT